MMFIKSSSDGWPPDGPEDFSVGSMCHADAIQGYGGSSRRLVRSSWKRSITGEAAAASVADGSSEVLSSKGKSIAAGNTGRSKRCRSTLRANASEGGFFLLLLLFSFLLAVRGLGAMSSIVISSGSDGLICAIEAGGKQQALCWGGNITDEEASTSSTALYGLSGGGGFVCGLKVGTFEPFCWKENQTDTNVVPVRYQEYSYSSIAAGASHVCAVKSWISPSPGKVDCWSAVEEDVIAGSSSSSSNATSPPSNLPLLRQVVAGNNFSCGLSNQTGHVFCWGESAFNLTDPPKLEFESLAAGAGHVCGILRASKQAKCWGDESSGKTYAPQNIRFVSLAGGYDHSCGIREDNHAVMCWGSFNRSAVPQGAGFLAIAAAYVTCGVREDNLLVDCWGDDHTASPGFDQPLQLFSPGLCSSSPCGSDEFYFNASNLGVPDVASVCLNSSEQICAPCASACPSGTFLSSPCHFNRDRQCTPCSLCQNETCRAVCSDSPQSLTGFNVTDAHVKNKFMGFPAILGAALSGGLVVACLGAFFLLLFRKKRGKYYMCSGRRSESESVPNGSNSAPSMTTAMSALSRHSNEMIRMQAFRLAEIREATNNFKELNELGRGNYGFVYKAVLPDGRQVAVKRANAARRIHSNSRDFEAELEILCKVRHAHLVNLLGYCEEMGERLLVYEFMPHGTLHDHLHSGLSPLSWGLRLKIALQAARGVEYLHKDASPRIVHRDIKSSNILLDGEWGARVADFGLSPSDKPSQSPSLQGGEVGYVDPDYYKSQNFTEKSDVYSFGVVLLELLSGRKALDIHFNPPNIVEWAAPLIRQGKAASILDRSSDLPKNVEPLLRMAEIAEGCVREKPDERPSMSAVAAWLEQIARSM